MAAKQTGNKVHGNLFIKKKKKKVHGNLQLVDGQVGVTLKAKTGPVVLDRSASYCLVSYHHHDTIKSCLLSGS